MAASVPEVEPAAEAAVPVPEAQAPAGDAPEEAEAPVEEQKEVTYGLAVEPEVAFETARAAAKQLHECLDRLSAGKAPDGTEVPDFNFALTARTMHLELLTMRRAHRAMVKVTDAGRTQELAARRQADVEHANLQTRIYESSCCRAAARRCRNFPTPQLNKLRPMLEGEGAGEEDEEAEANGNVSNSLAARLEAERAKRTSLFAELETLEQQKAKDLEAFQEISQFTNGLFTRLRSVEQALEPVCDLLPFKPRSAQSTAEGWLQLPSTLQLVHRKFDVLTAFGSGSVALRIQAAEDAKPPPEKRTKVEGATASTKPPASVFVEIACAKGNKVLLQFSSPLPSLVTVAVEGDGNDAILEVLWPGDDGKNPNLVAMLPTGDAVPPGRPFGWAQILAGLRETLVAEAPALQSAEGVTAADVVQRVRVAAEASKA